MLLSFDSKSIEEHARLLLPLFDEQVDIIAGKELQIQNLNLQLTQSRAQILSIQSEKESLLNDVQELQEQVEVMKKQLSTGQASLIDDTQLVENVDKACQHQTCSQDEMKKQSCNKGVVRAREESENDACEPPFKKQQVENPEHLQLSHPIIIIQGIVTIMDGDGSYKAALDVFEEKVNKILRYEVGIPRDVFFLTSQLYHNPKLQLNYEVAGELLVGSTRYRLATAWAVLNQDYSQHFIANVKCKLDDTMRGKSDWLQFCSEWNLMCWNAKDKQIPSQKNSLFAFAATPEDILKLLPESCRQYLVKNQDGEKRDDARVRKQMEDDEYLSLLEEDVQSQEQRKNNIEDQAESSVAGINSLLQLISSTQQQVCQLAQEKLQLIKKLDKDNTAVETKFFRQFEQMKKLLEEKTKQKVEEKMQNQIDKQKEEGSCEEQKHITQQEFFEKMNQRMKILGLQFTAQQIINMPLKCVRCNLDILPYCAEPQWKNMPEFKNMQNNVLPSLRCYKCKEEEEEEEQQQQGGSKQVVDFDEVNRRLKFMGTQFTIQDVLSMPLQCCICCQDFVPWQKEPQGKQICATQRWISKQERKENWRMNVQNHFFTRSDCFEGCSGFCYKCAQESWREQKNLVKRNKQNSVKCVFCKNVWKTKPVPFVQHLRSLQS